MQIAFSKKFTYDREGLLLVTLGMGLYLASVTVNQACLAQGQVRRAAARWIALRGLLHRLELRAARRATSSAGSRSASLLTAGVLFALLYPIYRRPHERAEDVPEPGSPEELEARLAIHRRERLARSG